MTHIDWNGNKAGFPCFVWICFFFFSFFIFIFIHLKERWSSSQINGDHFINFFPIICPYDKAVQVSSKHVSGSPGNAKRHFLRCCLYHCSFGGGMILLLQKEMPLKACKKQKTNACRRRWERMERPVGQFFHWWGSMDAWTERMKSLLDLQMIIMCKLTPPFVPLFIFLNPPLPYTSVCFC